MLYQHLFQQPVLLVVLVIPVLAGAPCARGCRGATPFRSSAILRLYFLFGFPLQRLQQVLRRGFQLRGVPTSPRHPSA